MTFRVPHKFTGAATISAEQLNENFRAIASKFNGGLTGSNLGNGIIDSDTQLLHNEVIVPIVLKVSGAQWQAAASGDVLAAQGVPIYGTSFTLTAIDATWYCSDIGSQDGTFSVAWGTYTSGTWAQTTSILGTRTIDDTGSANNTAGSEPNIAISGSVTVDTTPRVFALLCQNPGTGVMSTNDDFLTVTLMFKYDLDTGF